MEGKLGRVCNGCVASSGEAVRLSAMQQLGLRAEKKLLGDLAGSKGIVDAVLTDDVKELLDAFFAYVARLASDEAAGGLRKDLVKIVVKLGVLARHQQLNKDELAAVQQLRDVLQRVFNAIITFLETPFTFDADVLRASFGEAEALLLKVIEGKLTERSRRRVTDTFGWLRTEANLAPLFNDKTYADDRARVGAALHGVLDKNYH